MDHPDPLIRSLADVIREAIADAGLSISEASLAAGIPKTTLLRRINTPSPFAFDEIASLARATNTTPAALVATAQVRASNTESPASAATGTSDSSPRVRQSQVEDTSRSAERTTKRAGRSA